MSRLGRKGLIIFLDTVLVNAAVIAALLIRFESLPIEDWRLYALIMVVITSVRLMSNYCFGLYRRSWRYASVDEVIAIVAAVSVGSLANALLLRHAFGFLPPRSVALLCWFLHIFLFGGSRFAWRLLGTRRVRLQNEEPEKNVLIVGGAGDGGFGGPGNSVTTMLTSFGWWALLTMIPPSNKTSRFWAFRCWAGRNRL